MIEDKQVLATLNSTTIKYYKSRGYDTDSLKRKKNGKFSIPRGTKLLIKIEDLPLQSNIFINVKCDYCGKIILKTYSDYNRERIINKDCCDSCKQTKVQETNQLKYGVNSTLSIKSVQNKIANTIQQKYGVTSPMKNKNIRQKQENTLMKNYGVKVPAKSAIIKNRMNATNNERYGVCNYFSILTGENHSRWSGGATKIGQFLRDSLTLWKKSSMQNSNFKCVITNKRFDVIHHLYSFDQILQETFKETNLPMYQQIKDYTQDELNTLSNKCIELHNKYPLGVCLTKEIHELFHQISNYGSNTPEQFYEFQQRYNNGEFTSFLSA